MNDDTPHGVMGSPSKLTDELIAKAAEYLTVFRSEGDLIPTVAGLSCYLGVSRSSIYNYKGKNQDFLDTVEQLDSLQEKILINGGLSGDFNAAITKLIMNNHGYSDKQVVDNTSSDGSMSPQAVPDYSRLSDDELRQYAELESKAASDKS